MDVQRQCGSYYSYMFSLTVCGWRDKINLERRRVDLLGTTLNVTIGFFSFYSSSIAI